VSNNYGNKFVEELKQVFGYGENPYISKKRLAALGAATVAAAGLLVAGFALKPRQETQQSAAAPSPTAPLALPQALEPCPQPSEASIQRVDDILNEPRRVLQREVDNVHVRSYDGINWVANTMLGETPEGNVYWGNRFLKNYGVKLKIGFGDNEMHGSMRTPTEAELNKDFAYSNLARGVVEGFDTVPTNLIAFSGLKQIRAVYSKAGWQWRLEYPNTIDWNVRKYKFVDDVVAEIGIPLGYLTEHKICGPEGMNTDPGFEALNGTQLYKDEGQTNHY